MIGSFILLNYSFLFFSLCRVSMLHACVRFSIFLFYFIIVIVSTGTLYSCLLLLNVRLLRSYLSDLARNSIYTSMRHQLVSAHCQSDNHGTGILS